MFWFLLRGEIFLSLVLQVSSPFFILNNGGDFGD